MRYPLLIVCEKHRQLTEMLRKLAQTRQWLFRARHQPASCLRLLRRRTPTVLVLRAGSCLTDRSLERDLKLLERISLLVPDTMTIVLNEGDHPALAGLAWDLGATYVLPASQGRERLPDLITGLMKSAVQCSNRGSQG